MIYLLLLPLALGILIAVMMSSFQVDKRYTISPFLMSIAPVITFVLAIFMILAQGSGGELLPRFSSIDIIIANIICTFLLSLSVVWIYCIKSFPYVFIITLINGVAIPVVMLLLGLSLEVHSNWLVHAWAVAFAGYTAFYLHRYDLPADTVGDENKIQN